MLKSKCFFLLAGILLSFCSWNIPPAHAYQQNAGRRISLTLIPNYTRHKVQFDGSLKLNSSSDPLDLAGLPFKVRRKWQENGTWYIMGVVTGGKVVYDEQNHVYHLRMGPIHLKPFDELNLLFPFANLSYSEIQPRPKRPDQSDENSLQQNHRLLYRAEADGWEIDFIDIPFIPVVKKIDLVLTPLIGEARIGKTDSFRFSGRVHFESLRQFREFGHHCQNAVSRIADGDYRIGSLLEVLDDPSFFSPDVRNSGFQFKPTSVVLKSVLMTCQYDLATGLGQVEAAFSGRAVGFEKSNTFFPAVLQGKDSLERNFPEGRGYRIQFGRIVLGPADVLTISIPHSLIQVDGVRPRPDRLSAGADQETLLEYHGPSAFDLSVPYIPQTQQYIQQFPAILRPSLAGIETQLGRLFSFKHLFFVSPVLVAGLLLLSLAAFLRGNRGLVAAGWLLTLAGFYYGVRGSFGLLGLAAAFYISQMIRSEAPFKINLEALKRVAIGLAGLALIWLATHLDRSATGIFRGLSEPDLSPFTPLVLAVLTAGLFTLFYGFPRNAKNFRPLDMPVLLLFLIVLALYDALDKSLMALVSLFLGGAYIARRASLGNDGGVKNAEEFGHDLQKRMALAFGNRLVPFSMLALIVFAVAHDLSSLYASELNITVSWLAAPLVIPLLDLVSVLITLVSVAILFVLVYPFLPSKAGYMKAVLFASFLFFVFLFGVGTDDRLILSLPNILVGRVIYYLSVPMLIGLYFDIDEFMEKENQRRATEGKDEKPVNLQTAGSMYLRNFQGLLSTLAGIFSLLAPSIYAFVSNQPVITTYFSLLEKLVLMPI